MPVSGNPNLSADTSRTTPYHLLLSLCRSTAFRSCQGYSGSVPYCWCIHVNNSCRVTPSLLLPANLSCLSVKNNDVDHHLIFHQERTDGIDCNLQSLVFRIAVNAGGNQRKGHRLTAIFFCQVQRCPITGFQKLLFPMLAIPPTWTDCMDHIFAGRCQRLGVR